LELDYCCEGADGFIEHSIEAELLSVQRLKSEPAMVLQKRTFEQDAHPGPKQLPTSVSSYEAQARTERSR